MGAALAGGQDCAGKSDTAKAAHHDKHGSMSVEECKAAMAVYKTRGWIGLMLDDEGGAMVVKEVVAESPAEQAGFQAGDTLVAFKMPDKVFQALLKEHLETEHASVASK